MLWEDNYLMHHGIKGQKWGIRRFQNEDGSLTPEGQERYNRLSDDQKRQFNKMTPKQRASILSRDNSASNKSMGELSPEQRRQRVVGNFLKGLGIVLGAAAVGYAGYKGVQYYQGKQKEIKSAYKNAADAVNSRFKNLADKKAEYSRRNNMAAYDIENAIKKGDASGARERFHQYRSDQILERGYSEMAKTLNEEYMSYAKKSETTPGVKEVIQFIRNKGRVYL